MKQIWTDEQNAAISYPSKTGAVLVSAAAGSGKTAVLVERVIRLLTLGENGQNPIPADKTVVVTFTRKAAAEMKSRLEKVLKALAGTNTREAQIARTQLVRLEEAKITTIDAFCIGLLREYPDFAGLESGFGIADESELAILRKKAMAETLECFYELPPEEVETVCAFFGAGSDKALRRAIFDLYEFTRYMPDIEGWIDEQLRLYDNPDEYFAKLVPPYYESVRKDIAKAITLTVESLDNAVSDGAQKFLQKDLEFFNGYYNDYNYKGVFPRMNVNKEDEISKEIIKANRAVTMKISKEIVPALALIAPFKETVSRLRPIVKMLARLFWIYCDKFTEVKRRRKLIDFSDAEQLTLQLLKNGSKSIVERIRRDCELIIVDEFQDSNFLQYEIFRYLDGDNKNKSKLFLVGDIKQSIYRFRGADSAVFDGVSRNPDYTVMYLSKNFRSSDQVIDGVNGIFESAMPDYDENARLRSGREISDVSYGAELCLLNDCDFPDMDGVTAEAEYTAYRIKHMVQSGFKIADKNGLSQELRECNWGDFSVLSGSAEEEFRVYERVFTAHGIPCVSAGGYGYLKTEEIGLALDLLTVINNPYNDLSLFNIMMSPMYGFTAEEVAVIRADRKDIPLYSAVLQCKKSDMKTAAFLKDIARYRRIADMSSAGELIAAINGEGGFLPLIANVRKKANIRLLVYYAEVFARNSSDCGLPSFLSYIKELKENGRDIKQAKADTFSKTAGSVRFMTVHAAKGLEFPVCFVARVNKGYNFRGDKETVLVKADKTAGITMNDFEPSGLCRIKTLHWEYEKRINKHLTIEEEKRKLYVAATRAECKLIFTGFVKKGTVKEDSYLQLIQGGKNITERVIRKEDIEEMSSVTDCNVSENGQVTDVEFAEEADEIRANIALEYPRKLLFTVPRKLTATQVSAEQTVGEQISGEYDEPSVFPRNPSFHGLKRLTGKKRGDAYHKAMELIDFTKGNYSEQFRNIKDRFTLIEYNAINPADITGFFESPLGQRAVKSEKVVKEYKLYTEIELSELGITGITGADFPDKPFVQGIADMFFYEGGEIVLVDYKTNRNTTPEKLILLYKGQLGVYKKAIEEMTGTRVKECVIYSFELGEIDLCL